MKGLAAILVEQNQPLALEEIEIPPPRLGQVLVKVLCSGICGSQIGEIQGVKGPDRYLPHLLGHEGAGIVLECGEGVRHVRVGDKVVMHWRKGAGLESVTPTYKSRIGKVNAGWVTTFNEYAIVSENRLTTIPSDFDPEIASLFGCAVTTGFGVINNNAQLKIGESIVIFGAGGIGLNMVQAAAMVSAYPIVAVDLHDNRLDLATKLGATHALNSTQCDVASEVRKIVGAEGADVTVDNTGNVGVIERAYELTNSRGRTILVGVPPKGSSARIATLPLHFEKRILGSHGGEANPHHDIPRYSRLHLERRLPLREIVAATFPLRDINVALAAMLEATHAGRIMLRIATP